MNCFRISSLRPLELVIDFQEKLLTFEYANENFEEIQGPLAFDLQLTLQMRLLRK